MYGKYYDCQNSIFDTLIFQFYNVILSSFQLRNDNEHEENSGDVMLCNGKEINGRDMYVWNNA